MLLFLLKGFSFGTRVAADRMEIAKTSVLLHGTAELHWMDSDWILQLSDCLHGASLRGPGITSLHHMHLVSASLYTLLSHCSFFSLDVS